MATIRSDSIFRRRLSALSRGGKHPVFRVSDPRYFDNDPDSFDGASKKPRPIGLTQSQPVP